MSALQALNVVHMGDVARHDDATNPADKRRALRRRVLKGAIAAFNDRHCSVACTVRDISSTGARLRTEGSVNIPDTFELLIELDGTEADCEVVWRKGDEVGVRFIGAPRRAAPRRRQTLAVATPESRVTLRRNRKPYSST